MDLGPFVNVSDGGGTLGFNHGKEFLMSRRHILFAAFAASLLGLISVASALTVNQAVTPAFIKDNPKRFSVTAEKRNDGLIHFTITRFVPRPSYLVATTEICEGDKILFQSTSTAFVREDSVTYYVTVAPERIADAKFELFEGSFAESDGKHTPVPGGTDFQIQLGEFAKLARELK